MQLALWQRDRQRYAANAFLAQQHSVLTQYSGPHSSPKCGPAPLRLPTHSRGQTHQRNHHLVHPRQVDTTPLQARPIPRRAPRLGTALWFP
jgi:hypothetical protein